MWLDPEDRWYDLLNRNKTHILLVVGNSPGNPGRSRHTPLNQLPVLLALMISSFSPAFSLSKQSGAEIAHDADMHDEVDPLIMHHVWNENLIGTVHC
jgi:hypothetical protein